MAQLGPAATQLNQGHITSQVSGLSNTFAVVNEHPRQRESFPYKLHINWILGLSILNCTFGFFLMALIIGDMVQFKVKGVPTVICSSFVFIINGAIGCALKCCQNKCLTGAFLAFSILSLMPDGIILWYFSDLIDFLVDYSWRHCYLSYTDGYVCKVYTPDEAIKRISFLLSIIICQSICSIGSIAVSCTAYCKFCSTCDANDCCTCLGCCECDTQPLRSNQSRESYTPCDNNFQVIHMPFVQQQNLQNQPIQRQLNTAGQDSAPHDQSAVDIQMA